MLRNAPVGHPSSFPPRPKPRWTGPFIIIGNGATGSSGPTISGREALKLCVEVSAGGERVPPSVAAVVVVLCSTAEVVVEVMTVDYKSVSRSSSRAAHLHVPSIQPLHPSRPLPLPLLLLHLPTPRRRIKQLLHPSPKPNPNPRPPTTRRRSLQCRPRQPLLPLLPRLSQRRNPIQPSRYLQPQPIRHDPCLSRPLCAHPGRWGYVTWGRRGVRYFARGVWDAPCAVVGE